MSKLNRHTDILTVLDNTMMSSAKAPIGRYEDGKVKKYATYGFIPKQVELKDFIELCHTKAIAPNTFIKNERSKQNLVGYGQYIMLDFDDGITWDELEETMNKTPYAYVIASSFSNDIDNNVHKMRLILKGQGMEEYLAPISSELYEEAWRNIARELGLFEQADPSCFDSARMFHPNRKKTETDDDVLGVKPYMYRARLEGENFDWFSPLYKAFNNPEETFKPKTGAGASIQFFSEDALTYLKLAKEYLLDNGLDTFRTQSCPNTTHESADPVQVSMNEEGNVMCHCHSCSGEDGIEHTWNLQKQIFLEAEGSFNDETFIEPIYTELSEGYDTPVKVDEFVILMKSIFDGWDIGYSEAHVGSWKSICRAFNKTILENQGKTEVHTKNVITLKTGGGKTTALQAYLQLLAPTGIGALIVATKINTIDELMVEVNDRVSKYHSIALHSQMGKQHEDSEYNITDALEAAEVFEEAKKYHEYNPIKKKHEPLYHSNAVTAQKYPAVFITQASFKNNQASAGKTMEDLLVFGNKKRDLVIVDESINYNIDVQVKERDLIALSLQIKTALDEEWFPWDEYNEGVEDFAEGISPADVGLAVTHIDRLLTVMVEARRAFEEKKTERTPGATGTFGNIFIDDKETGYVSMPGDMLNDLLADKDNYDEDMEILSTFLRHSYTHRTKDVKTFGDNKPWNMRDFEVLKELYEDVWFKVKSKQKPEKEFFNKLKTYIMGTADGLGELGYCDSYYLKSFGDVSINSAYALAPKNVSIVYLDATAHVNISGALLQKHTDELTKVNFIDMPQDVRDYSNAEYFIGFGKTGRGAIFKDKKKLNGKKLSQSVAILVESIKGLELGAEDKLLIVGYKDMKSAMHIQETFDFEIDFTYWQGFYGENKWRDFNTVLILGRPVLPDNIGINEHMLSTSYDHAIVNSEENKQEKAKLVNSKMIEMEIQGLNRIRCRVASKDGDGTHEPIKVFRILDISTYNTFSQQLVSTLNKEMPGISIYMPTNFEGKLESKYLLHDKEKYATPWFNNMAWEYGTEADANKAIGKVKRDFVKSIVELFKDRSVMKNMHLSKLEIAENIGLINAAGEVMASTWSRYTKANKFILASAYNLIYMAQEGNQHSVVQRPARFIKAHPKVAARWKEFCDTNQRYPKQNEISFKEK